MRIDLFGGFGEKGRTSVGIACQQRIILDIGIKVGSTGWEYYPTITPQKVQLLDAAFVSHAHEDHIGGLNWLLANGFRGKFYMTQETMDDAQDMLAQYADPAQFRSHPLTADRIEVFKAGDAIRIGDLAITSGRSGHVAGGVWFSVKAEGKHAVYCGDVVPNSQVFVMDPLPACDLLMIDASYGGDRVTSGERGRAIQQFIIEHADGCLLPVPLSGKPLELMAVLPQHFAIHASMRASLAQQIAVPNAIAPDVADYLRKQLAGATDWVEGKAFPDCPLLTHDGMGSAGPSVFALNKAREHGLPVLLTGHVPPNTPAEAMVKAGQATWARLPTHPTLAENVEFWEQAGKPDIIGHSCPLPGLTELKPSISNLRTGTLSGSYFEI